MVTRKAPAKKAPAKKAAAKQVTGKEPAEQEPTELPMKVKSRYRGAAPVSPVFTERDPMDELLTKSEVAALLRVDPKTVARWDTLGKLQALRTPGGHRRFLRSDIEALMRKV